VSRISARRSASASILARLTYPTLIPFERLLRQEAPRFPFGATIVVVSAIMTEPIHAALIDLQTAGHPIALVMIGQPRDADLPALPTYFVTQNWTEMERLEL
jgi:hypothetical protein